MAPIFLTRLLDKTGEEKAQFKSFNSLHIELKWCDMSNYQMTISVKDDRYRLFEDDDLIDIMMVDHEEGIPWMSLGTFIHKTPVKQLFADGSKIFTSYGPSPEELLAKENILWPAGTLQSTKSGIVSSVMYEYVRENIGDLALASLGRDLDGAVSGLVLDGDFIIGPSWSGSNSRKSLLGAIKELSVYSYQQKNPVDFRVTHTGGYNWMFTAEKLSVDRTNVGLDPATHKNGAGNDPVIFSEANGNITEYSRSRSRYNALTNVVALGGGTGEFRNTATAENTTELLVSPIARRTDTINASASSASALQAIAEEKLHENEPGETFTFTPRNSGNVIFRDYFLGDYITAEDDGTEFHKQVIGIIIDVNAAEPYKVVVDYRDV